MSLHASALALLAALPLGAAAQAPAASADPFPASSALAEGVSPEALANLGALVQSLVDEGEIVGAELLVIKNGRSLLHEAYGSSDLEGEVPVETGSVFCVRSMTKPLIGTSILMLIDENVIELDDPIAKYLPVFDVEGKRGITIEHLLTHTSGMRFSMIAGVNPRELESIQAVAALGAGAPLEFEPGSDFQYSDQGTDTLTALLEVVTGAPAEDFVRVRLLEPLGMQHSTCLMTADHPLRARAISKYVGSRHESSTEALATLESQRAESIRLDNIFAHFGDLLAWHPGLHVIQDSSCENNRTGGRASVYSARPRSAPRQPLPLPVIHGRTERAHCIQAAHGRSDLAHRRGVHVPTLAGEGDQRIAAACETVKASEAMGQDFVAQVGA